MAGQVNIGVNLDFNAQNLAQIQKQLNDALNVIEKNGVKLGLSPETISQMKAEVSKLSESIVKNFNNTTGKINFDKVRVDLEKAGVSAAGLGARLQTVGVNGQSAFNSITKSAYTFEKKVKSTETLLNKFSHTLNNTISWNISSSIVNQISGEIQKAIYFTKDLDKSLNNIRIVSGASKDEMAEFAIEANNAAKALKTTTVEYSDAALVYFQQGLAADDVRKMTEATVMGANIAGESTEEMSNLLTSTMNGYKMAADEALDVTDKLSAVGAATAADFYELATGMSKVASMANAAGVDIDRLNAQLATIVSVTKEAPESVGTSLKTIYGRMLAFKNNATDLMEDEDGELFGAPSVEAALEKFSKATGKSISLFETTKDGTKVMRDLGDVIDEIGDAWQETDNLVVKFGLTTALAGSRQQNRLVALFDAWDDYKDAVTTSLNAEGTTLRQNEIYMDSYAAHAKELKSSMESLYMELFDSDDMIGVVDVINKIVEGLTSIVDLLGGLPGVLGVIGGLMSQTVFSKQLSGLGAKLTNKKIAENFKGAGPEGVRQDGTFSSDYKKDETKYKGKLQTISSVFKGEDFETVRKMTEELLKQKKQLEEVRASAKLLQEAYERTNDIIVNSDAAKGVLESMEEDTEGNIKATDKLNKKLLEFKTTYSDNLTGDAAAEFKDLQVNLKQSEIKVSEFEEQFKNLIKTMANAKAQGDLGLDTNFDELSQEGRQLEKSYKDNARVLEETLDPMEKYSKKIDKIRDGVSGAIPVLTTLFSTIGDDSKSAGEKFLGVLTALGTALSFQMDTIIGTTIAKTSETIVTDLQTASEMKGVPAKLASAAAESTGTKAIILGTAAKVSATIANGALTVSFKTLAAAIWKALAPILPFVIAIGTLVGAGYGLVKLFDALITTEKELQEQSQEAADALAEVQNRVSDLESKVESLNDQINNLDPITDAEEIAELKRLLELTEAQLAAEKELEKVRAKEANQAQYDYLKEAYDDKDFYLKTDQDKYEDKISEAQAARGKLEELGVQDVSEVDQLIATKQAELETAKANKDSATKKQLEKEIKELEKYSSRYTELTTELAEETNEILSEVGKIDLSQLDENNEADKPIIALVNSLKASADRALLELNPSDFIERFFSEADLNKIVDTLSSGGDISGILSKYETAFSTLGVTTDEMKGYLQNYTDAMQKSEGVVEDSQSKYERLTNNINLLSKSYQDGEINFNEYAAGLQQNIEKLGRLKIENPDLAKGINETVDSISKDIVPVIEDLGRAYKNGEISIEEYNESSIVALQTMQDMADAGFDITDSFEDLIDTVGALNFDAFIQSDFDKQWAQTLDTLDAVEAGYKKLYSAQEELAKGNKISADSALALAKVYPQILAGATVTTDKQLALNDEVVKATLEGKANILQAAAQEQIDELEIKKQGLIAENQVLQAKLDAITTASKSTLDINALQNELINIDNSKAADTATKIKEESSNDIGKSSKEETDLVGKNAIIAGNNIAAAYKAAAIDAIKSISSIGKAMASVANGETPAGVSSKGYIDTTAIEGETLEITSGFDQGKFLNDLNSNKGNAAAIDDILKGAQSSLQAQIEANEAAINQLTGQQALIEAYANKSYNNYQSGTGGGGSSGSGETTEEYLAKIDTFKKYLQELAEVQAEIEKINDEINNAETSEEKLKLLDKKIALYKKERVALNDLANARRAIIKTNVETLRNQGFDVEYDEKNNKLQIKNEEHINDLKEKNAEATNELRKATEELIATTEDLNESNKDSSASWWDSYYEQKEALKTRLDTEIEMYKEQLDNERRVRDVSIQDIKDSYDDMVNALKKAYDEGIISSEEFWGRLAEIGEEKMDEIRKDIENTIEYAKLIGRITPEQEAGYWTTYRGQVNEMMALGQISSYDEYVSELRDVYEKIDNSLKEVYNSSVKNQEHAINMLALAAGTEEKQIAIYRNIMEETYNEAQRLRAKNYEANKETIQDLEKEWYSYYQKIIALQRQMLEKQQENKESTISSVVSVIDNKIQELEDQKEALSTLAELDDMLLGLKSDLLSADEDDKALIQEKIDYLEEQRDIYASLTDAEEKRLKMQEIEKALADVTLKQLERKVELAKNNLVQRVWHEDKGWVWEADQSAINDAQKELNDFKNEMAQTNIDNEINRLEDYKEKWQEIVDDYETEQNKLVALQELGAGWEAKILDKRLDVLETFKNGYVDILEQLNGLTDIENGIGGEKMPDYTVDKGTDDIFGGSDSHVYDLEAKYYGYDGRGYNASIDYSQAIIDAKKRNASEEEVLELKRIRNLKIKGEKMAQYYDSLDDFTERERELLAKQSANVADNAASTGANIASTIQNLQKLDNQWSTSLDLTEPLAQYKTQLNGLCELEQKSYKDRLEAANQFIKEFNSIMAKMSSGVSGGTSGGLQLSGTGAITYDKNVDYSAKIAEYKKQGAPASEIAKLEAQRAAKIKGENLNPDGTKKTSSTLKKKYATGGVNDYTGDAMLHGTPSSVETIFNAEDGKKLYDLVHNSKDLADSIAEDMVPYIPSLFENIGEIGFNPRNMMMPTVSKVEPRTIEYDESTTFSNCKFEIKTEANNFEALVNDMEVKIKNR